MSGFLNFFAMDFSFKISRFSFHRYHRYHTEITEVYVSVIITITNHHHHDRHHQDDQSSSSLLPANAADVCRSIIPIPTQALTHPIFSFSPFPNCCSPLVFVIADMVLCCLDYIGAHPIQAVQSFNTLLCLCNMNHSKGRALLER